MSVSESHGLPKAPLPPPSANAGFFERIGMDLNRAIGTVSTRASVCISSGGLCNRYPEAVALRNISAKSVAGGSVSV